MSKFYNKYRPQSFKEIIGQEPITISLKNLVKNKNFEKVFIFAGAHGTGKTTIARIFSKAINCLDNIDGDACNKCKNCKEFNKNIDGIEDYVEIDAASHNSVDDAMNLLSDAQYHPTTLKNKIYLIDEAHMLSKEAFSKYLKTFEEAQNNIIFILATTEMKRIPKTIISRSLVYPFKTVTHEEIEKSISKIAKLENITIEHSVLEKISDYSNGSFRDGIVLLEQLSIFSENHVSENHFNKFLEIPSSEEIKEFCNSLFKLDYKTVLTKITEWKKENFNLDKIIATIYLNYKKTAINLLLSSKNTEISKYFNLLKLFFELKNELNYGYQDYNFLESKILFYFAENNDQQNTEIAQQNSFLTIDESEVIEIVKSNNKDALKHWEKVDFNKEYSLQTLKLISAKDKNNVVVLGQLENEFYTKLVANNISIFIVPTNLIEKLKNAFQNNNQKPNSIDLKKINLQKILKEKFTSE